MLDLKTADITQTRFYQDVFQEGEATLIIRQLTRLLGNLPEPQTQQIRSLPQARLEALGEALLEFTSAEDLQSWLNAGENT
jgi:predicted transposase YdaD